MIYVYFLNVFKMIEYLFVKEKCKISNYEMYVFVFDFNFWLLIFDIF